MNRLLRGEDIAQGPDESRGKVRRRKLRLEYRAATLLAKPRAIAQAPQAAGAVGVIGQIQSAVQQLGGRLEDAPSDTGNTSGISKEGAGEMDDGIIGGSQQATVVRRQVIVPPRYQVDALGVQQRIERQPGEGGTITLKWPGYFQPSLDDVTKAVTAAGGALSGGLLDDEAAVNFIAPYFKVEDKAALLERIRAAGAATQADLMSQFTGGGEPDVGAAPAADDLPKVTYPVAPNKTEA